MEKIDFFSFKFIFIGETHGFIEDFNKEKEIIEKIEPEFVLSEQVQNLIFDTKIKKEEALNKNKISEMVKTEEIKDLIQICLKKDIKLIGMDLENFGFDKRLQAIVKGKIKPTKKDISQFEEIAKKREIQNLKIIREIQEKTKKSIIILTGTWHLRKDSPLMKELDNYIVIYPCIKEGEILLEPPKKNQTIKYCYKIKNGKNKI